MALDSFWTIPGRVDRFEFRKVSISSPTSADGEDITKYVKSCDLTYSYSSTEKMSGTMEVTDMGFLNNCYVRIYYKPYIPHVLDSKGKPVTKTEILGTFYAESSDRHYEDGIYSGNVKLKSVICRYTEDKLARNYTIKAVSGSKKKYTYQQWFKAACNKHFSKGPCKITGFSKQTYVKKNKTFTFGTDVWDVIKFIRDSVGGIVMPDEMGRVVLEKKVSPGSKSVSGTIPSTGSVVFLGMSVSSSVAEKKNRAALRGAYQVKDKKGNTKTHYVYSTYTPNVKNATWTVSARKRYVTATYEKDWGEKSKADAKKANDKLVKSKLSSSTTTNYEIQSFYLPLKLGSVWNFKYGKIKKRCLVSHKEISIRKDGLTMRTKLRKVGDWK